MRRLKEEGRPKLEVQAAVAELKARKKALEQREIQLTPKEEKFDRSKLDDLLKRRFFYTPSFSIYGGMFVCACVGPRCALSREQLLCFQVCLVSMTLAPLAVP